MCWDRLQCVAAAVPFRRRLRPLRVRRPRHGSAIESGGSGIQIGPGGQNIRMQNNTFVFSKAYDIEIPD